MSSGGPQPYREPAPPLVSPRLHLCAPVLTPRASLVPCSLHAWQAPARRGVILSGL